MLNKIPTSFENHDWVSYFKVALVSRKELLEYFMNDLPVNLTYVKIIWSQ